MESPLLPGAAIRIAITNGESGMKTTMSGKKLSTANPEPQSDSMEMLQDGSMAIIRNTQRGLSVCVVVPGWAYSDWSHRPIFTLNI